MSKKVVATKPRLKSIRKHLKAKGVKKPFTTISQFVSHIRETAGRWQEEDWKRDEDDEGDLLNIARILGQVWFRGQRNVKHGLQPGLYRESTWKNLLKKDGDPKPSDNFDGNLFSELFDLEHELRIDFTSFGHLLNQASHAKTPIDWYSDAASQPPHSVARLDNECTRCSLLCGGRLPRAGRKPHR